MGDKEDKHDDNKKKAPMSPSRSPKKRTRSSDSDREGREGLSRQDRRRLDGQDEPHEEEPARRRRRHHRSRSEDEAGDRGRGRDRERKAAPPRRRSKSRERAEWPQEDKHGRITCKTCGVTVGGGRNGFEAHCQTSKHHRTWLYHNGGMPWEQAVARANREWAKWQGAESVTERRSRSESSLRLFEAPRPKKPRAAEAVASTRKAKREPSQVSRGRVARPRETPRSERPERARSSAANPKQRSKPANKSDKKATAKLAKKKAKKANDESSSEYEEVEVEGESESSSSSTPAAKKQQKKPASNRAALEAMAELYQAQANVFRNLNK